MMKLRGFYGLPLLVLLCFITQEHGWTQENKVHFKVERAPEIQGFQIGIRGNKAPFSWDKTIFLKNNAIVLRFEHNLDNIEYKYVLDNGTDVKWEGISNREIQLDKNGMSVADTWNKETPVDITTLIAIPSEQLLEDFKLLEHMVLQVHPGTYRYSSKAEIEKALSDLKAKFQNPLSLGEAYLAMSKATAAIKCDHTKVGFNNQNRYVNSVIHEQEDKLPFTFKWFGEKMIVDRNVSEHAILRKGTEIIAINDVPVAKILSALLPYVAADGATDKNRIQKLEIDGFDFRYNAFDIFFPLKFPMEGGVFKFSVSVNGNVSEVEVKGMHREIRAEKLRDKFPDFPFTRDDMWAFQTNKDVGMLTLNSFGLMGWKAMTLDYKKFLDKTFTALQQKKIKHLIIDIRGNTGGNDEMKIELFRYLSFDRQEIPPTAREGRTRYVNFPEQLKPHIKTWGDNPWFYQLEPDRQTGHYYIFDERFENRKPLPTKPNMFQGKVYLLVGPSNTSLAFYTARDFQHYKIGALIGGETGGNLKDINGGQILFLTLPNSGIEIDFPVMGGFSKELLPNSGVIPDHEVEMSLHDFRHGIDPVMDKAYELIRIEEGPK